MNWKLFAILTAAFILLSALTFRGYQAMNAWDAVFNGLDYQLPEVKRKTGIWPSTTDSFIAGLSQEDKAYWKDRVNKYSLSLTLLNQSSKSATYQIRTKFGTETSKFSEHELVK